MKAVLDKAARKNDLRAIRKLTVVVDGCRVIISDPRLADPKEDVEFDAFSEFFARYRETLRPRRSGLRQAAIQDI